MNCEDKGSMFAKTPCMRASTTEKVRVIPKTIEKYKHFFNYRQLTPTAIMNVLKQNFDNEEYFPGASETYILINKKSTMEDNFAKPNKPSCTVEVIGISMYKYQFITPAEITMLFNCNTLYIKVAKSEKMMKNSEFTTVVIRNDIVHTENYEYYSSLVTTEPLDISMKTQRRWKDNTKFKVVLNNFQP